MPLQLEFPLSIDNDRFAEIITFPNLPGKRWRREVARCRTYSDAIRTGYRMACALERREATISTKDVPEGVQACFRLVCE